MVQSGAPVYSEILRIIAIVVSISTPIIGGVWAIIRQLKNERGKYMAKEEANDKFKVLHHRIDDVERNNCSMYTATVDHFDNRFNDLIELIKTIKN